MNTENTNLSFTDIIGELSKTVQNNKKTIGNLVFSQVNYKQQRSILNSGYDQVEIPAKMSNIYNTFIGENVKIADDMVSSTSTITLENKIPVLVALRIITLGDEYVDDETNMTYKFPEITEEMITKSISSCSIKFDDFEIILDVPTLDKETYYNSILMQLLNPYKNKKNIDKVIGQVADLYEQYNIIKYITTIKWGKVEFDFNERSRQEKEQFINRLGGDIISQIKKYINDSHRFDDIALTVTNDETGDTKLVDVNTLFFVKSK